MSAPKLALFFDRALVASLVESWERVGIPVDGLVDEASDGLDDLALLDRGRHIAAALRRRLPAEPTAALGQIVASLGAEHATDELIGVGMAPFRYLPHAFLIGEYGVSDPEAGFAACEALTRRFSAEGCVRPLLVAHPEAGARALDAWVIRDNPHVRRLVSEGTRPLLPWAPRLTGLDPWTFVPWLERLRFDPAELVRRSVANHVNDLGRLRPDAAAALATRWADEGVAPRLIRHAMRGLVKRGHPTALRLLGAGDVPVEVLAFDLPTTVALGARLPWCARLATQGEGRVVVDVRLTGPTGNTKVFKGAVLDGGGGEHDVEGVVSFAPMTTRRHHLGRHTLTLQVDGGAIAERAFELVGG